MNKDISHILRSWDYQPNTLSVRKIKSEDGTEKIQIRINLGILQMNAEGRPDGKTPHDMISLLEYYRSVIMGSVTSDEIDEIFMLNETDMKEIDEEIMQYYQRRICFFALKDYASARRDAEHNLELMDVIKDHCDDEEYVESHEQFRPFVVMERARAASMESISSENYAAAMTCVGEAIDMIEDFYEERGAMEMQGRRELAILRKWRSQIHEDWEGGASEIMDSLENDDYEMDDDDDEDDEWMDDDIDFIL